jgi:hypothetical protein
MAHARISTLEAELKSSVEAWESANAGKVSAEKAAKSVETNAKKAEKALADAHQKQDKREQSIVEQLDKISISVGSKCCITPFLDTYLGFHLLICVYLFLFVSLWYSRENWRILETSAAKY